ncbi:MAG: arginase family protein [Patescibacteria group bacterium]|nr:arginase family protein [Patescibacteria group bacterium]
MQPSKGHFQALKQLENIVTKIIDDSKLPIVLGGEHSITLGSLKALIKKTKKLTICQFDTHADLRESWLGSKLSHAAVMHRCLEVDKEINLVQIGIRNISEEELPFLEKNKRRIKTFWAKDKKIGQLKKL